jgi:hypothetical protein
VEICTLPSPHMRTTLNTWSLHVSEPWNILELEHSGTFLCVYIINSILITLSQSGIYTKLSAILVTVNRELCQAALSNSANRLWAQDKDGRIEDERCYCLTKRSKLSNMESAVPYGPST